MCCFMLSSRTIRRVSCLSLWSKLEIALSRNDHFFGNGLSSSSFLFPPNVKHDVLDISVLFSPSILGIIFQFTHQNCSSRRACFKNAIKNDNRSDKSCTYLCTPRTGLPLTSHNSLRRHTTGTQLNYSWD